MKIKYDISKLSGRLSRIRDWLKDHNLPPKLLFITLGIISTIWFLIRVIPKPSRATYPCMRAAAPFMSGFVIYLLSLGGLTIALRKVKQYIFRSRYLAAFSFLVIALVLLFVVQLPSSLNLFADNSTELQGPADGPNQPIGTGVGINPGRVVWIWNPMATNENCVNTFDFYKPENTNQGVVNKMVADGIKKLSGKSNLKDSWEALFIYFNSTKGRGNKSYTPGEKIFIKVNQGTANSKLKEKDILNGFYIPEEITENDEAHKGYLGTCETNPNVVLEILRELVYVVGVEEKDIAIGDPISHIFGHNYEVWATEFPDVTYVDRRSEGFGRTLIHPTNDELIFYSDKKQNDKLYDVIENADYLINAANVKPHGRAGISLTAKNHFGSHARKSAFHLHYSLISPISLGHPTNNGYRKYRVQVDLMGSKYLGQNTLLYIVDGLYGGGSNETKVPVKYFMYPFNNDWCNSVFLSQDQVALESVCYDFLRTEWDGTFKHSDANNAYESIPNVKGVDDYLHQAAHSENWPEGIVYDPDDSGEPIKSLGVHEHWNNETKKQYSRNLGFQNGIELISIPDFLVGGNGTEVSLSQRQYENINVGKAEETKAESKTKQTKYTANKQDAAVIEQSRVGKINANRFYSVTVDENNTKWFLTESGIVSFDDKSWKLNESYKNKQFPTSNHFNNDIFSFDHELWITTKRGAVRALSPFENASENSSFILKNSKIGGDTVHAATVGNSEIKWFITNNGIAALKEDNRLPNASDDRYPKELFEIFPVTAIATNPRGDSLYVATEGAGISRLYKDDVDAISGASEYLQWGPIKIPSDSVYCIFIEPDGTQWFGTNSGLAKHIGNNSLDNWTVYTTENGLVCNSVQCITADNKGNIWVGTNHGVSIFNGSDWQYFSIEDGLISNNILCIALDKTGVIWMGTDLGVMKFKDDKYTRFMQ